MLGWNKDHEDKRDIMISDEKVKITARKKNRYRKTNRQA